MPKPSWLTLLLKILGFAGQVAGKANEVFPSQGHDSSHGRVNAPAKLHDLKAEAEKRRKRVSKTTQDAE